MSITVTLQNTVLTALAAFAATDDWTRTHQPALTDVLLEITPEAVRLVATDTHVLGCLRLTPDDGRGVRIDAPMPLELLLPVTTLAPLLKARKDPILTLAIDPETRLVTATNAAGLQLTVRTRAADRFPRYRTAIPALPAQAWPFIACDAALLARVTGVARALGVGAHLELHFHDRLGPIGVRLRGVDAFAALLMPLAVVEPEGMPAWFAPDMPAALPVAA